MDWFMETRYTIPDEYECDTIQKLYQISELYLIEVSKYFSVEKPFHLLYNS